LSLSEQVATLSDSLNTSDKLSNFNKPPCDYCSQYSSLPNTLSIDADNFLRHLIAAANTPIARCPHTGFSVETPLKAQAWALRLAATHYPDPAAAVTLVKCLRLGVDLGFRGDRSRCQVGPNLISAAEHPDAVTANIAKEQGIGRRKGPYTTPPFPYFYSNPLGVVFRKGKTKPRIIHHLSWPRHRSAGTSVNASTIAFEVKLDAFDRAVATVRELGKGCLMCKIDVESAYRCIPVQPADWPLQGMQWQDMYYFDPVMQFGLASATAIFEWYSSAAQYIAQHSLAIQHLVHYVDDFMMFVLGQDAAKLAFQRLLALFAELGIPVSTDKLEGPVTTMVFLGILFDTDNMQIRLEDSRLATIHAELDIWNTRSAASREELQSLIGCLAFASKVVAPGRTFLRRMIDHMSSIPYEADASAQYPLSESFHKDLHWWRAFMSKWNGVGIIPDTKWSPAHALHIFTDACVQGYGAIFGSHWFACKWTAAEEQAAARDKRDSMPYKELYALVVAAATWGPQWKGRKILFNCDSQTVVLAWRKGDSKSQPIAHLIRTLLFIAATNDFNMNLIHIAGVTNVGADLLSRGQVTRFLESPGQHDPSPTTPLPLPTLTW
jgi:hypothetical protein